MNITPSNQNFFKEQDVEIVLFPSTQTRKFSEIEDFINFIQNEYDFWIKCNDGRLKDIRTHFTEIHQHLSYIDNNESNLINSLNAAINLAKINRLPGVYSETVEAKFLKDIFLISYSQASAAYDYIFNNTIRNIQNSNNYDNFLGIMRAYNLKDRNKISEDNVAAEKKALDDLMNSYNTKLESLGSEFFSCSEQITKEFNAIQDKLNEGQEQFTNDTLSLLENSKQHINELEELYREKLRLEAPAEYWDKLNVSYTAKGEKWRNWALTTSSIFIVFLTIVLYNLPKDLFEQFGFNSVKTTLVFALIASIGIYIIRLFVMLSTSAFHLARDANERYQLTHVYLSLLSSKGINDTERSIVLQAIFSRADTGLLKGDSSPTLPGMLDQIIKNIKK